MNMPIEPENERTRSAQDELYASLRPDNLRQMKIGMATLAASVVETLSENDATFRDRFLDRLERVHENYRSNSDADPLHVLEVIHWTRELLGGWNPVPARVDSIFGVPAAVEAD